MKLSKVSTAVNCFGITESNCVKPDKEEPQLPEPRLTNMQNQMHQRREWKFKMSQKIRRIIT